MAGTVASLVANHLRVLRILWFAQLSTLAVFGVVLFVSKPPPTSGPEMIWVLAVAGALVVPAMLLVRRTVQGGTLGLLAPDDLVPSQWLDGPALESAVRQAAGRYQTGTIVGIAFAEAIALFGFVGSWTTGDLTAYPAFAVFAAALMLVQVPRLGGLRALLAPEARAGLDRALR